MDAHQAIDTYLGLLGIALVMFYLFNKPADTQTIIGSSANVGSQFVNTLQGR